MTNIINAKDRGRRILQLLKLYGPLSFRGVKAMIEPKMQDRRIHDAIARIYRNGLIEKRQERVFRGAGVFYQLSQHRKSVEKLTDLLQCCSNELKQPYFRSRELIHTEACALWTYQLKTWFPDAIIIRDYQFHSMPVAHEVMLTDRNDFDLRPDILMLLNQDDAKQRVVIAFEIEKSRKSERRLRAKLTKYANETALDGLVYLCDSDEVSEPVRRIYESRIMKKSNRISHYGENFFLFQNVKSVYETKNPLTFRNYLKPVSFNAWINELRRTAMNSRRDHLFSESAVSC